MLYARNMNVNKICVKFQFFLVYPVLQIKSALSEIQNQLVEMRKQQDELKNHGLELIGSVSTKKSENVFINKLETQNQDVSTRNPENEDVSTRKPENESVSIRKIEIAEVLAQKSKEQNVSTQKPPENESSKEILKNLMAELIFLKEKIAQLAEESLKNRTPRPTTTSELPLPTLDEENLKTTKSFEEKTTTDFHRITTDFDEKSIDFSQFSEKFARNSTTLPISTIWTSTTIAQIVNITNIGTENFIKSSSEIKNADTLNLGIKNSTLLKVANPTYPVTYGIENSKNLISESKNSTIFYTDAHEKLDIDKLPYLIELKKMLESLKSENYSENPTPSNDERNYSELTAKTKKLMEILKSELENIRKKSAPTVNQLKKGDETKKDDFSEKTTETSGSELRELTRFSENLKTKHFPLIITTKTTSRPVETTENNRMETTPETVVQLGSEIQLGPVHTEEISFHIDSPIEPKKAVELITSLGKVKLNSVKQMENSKKSLENEKIVQLAPTHLYITGKLPKNFVIVEPLEEKVEGNEGSTQKSNKISTLLRVNVVTSAENAENLHTNIEKSVQNTKNPSKNEEEILTFALKKSTLIVEKSTPEQEDLNFTKEKFTSPLENFTSTTLTTERSSPEKSFAAEKFSTRENSTPMVEKSNSIIEKSILKIKNSTFTLDESTTTLKKLTPITEKSTLDRGKSTLALKKSSPILENSTPNSVKSTSTTEKLTTITETPTTEKSTTTTEKSTPTTEKFTTTTKTPATEKSTTTTEKSTTTTETPTTEKSTTTTKTPTTGKSFPTKEKSTLDTEKSTQILEKLTPDQENLIPDVKKSSLNLKSSTPALEQSTPTTEKSTFGHEEPILEFKKSTPTQEKSASNIEKSNLIFEKSISNKISTIKKSIQTTAEESTSTTETPSTSTTTLPIQIFITTNISTLKSATHEMNMGSKVVEILGNVWSASALARKVAQKLKSIEEIQKTKTIDDIQATTQISENFEGSTQTVEKTKQSFETTRTPTTQTAQNHEKTSTRTPEETTSPEIPAFVVETLSSVSIKLKTSSTNIFSLKNTTEKPIRQDSLDKYLLPRIIPIKTISQKSENTENPKKIEENPDARDENFENRFKIDENSRKTQENANHPSEIDEKSTSTTENSENPLKIKPIETTTEKHSQKPPDMVLPKYGKNSSPTSTPEPKNELLSTKVIESAQNIDVRPTDDESGREKSTLEKIMTTTTNLPYGIITSSQPNYRSTTEKTARTENSITETIRESLDKEIDIDMDVEDSLQNSLASKENENSWTTEQSIDSKPIDVFEIVVPTNPHDPGFMSKENIALRLEQARRLREEKNRLDMQAAIAREAEFRTYYDRKRVVEEKLAQLADTERWQHELHQNAQLRQRAFANANVDMSTTTSTMATTTTTTQPIDDWIPITASSLDDTRKNRKTPKHCEPVQKFVQVFKVRDPIQWLKENCVFVKQYFPTASCSQIQEVLSSCFEIRN